MIGLIAWHRVPNGNGTKSAYPAFLADLLIHNAKDIGSVFDFVQWPSIAKAQGGNGPGCDGYEVFDPRDLGSKYQQGSVPTRWGALQSVLSAIAALNANGVHSSADIVIHQRGGSNGGLGYFKYQGADGTAMNGRGATTPAWFQGHFIRNADGSWADPIPPFCAQDDVPMGPNFPFGQALSYQHSFPKNVVLNDAIDFIQWFFVRTGMTYARMDDVKGTYAPAVAKIMNTVSWVDFYSEFFDNRFNSLNWATTNPMNGRSALEDFDWHWRLQSACNGFDATQLGGGALWRMRPDLAVVFVDNPDTDTSIGQQVISNKGIAYALTLNLPCRMALVYSKDYYPASSTMPGAYGLRKIIDNISWFSRMFAIGNYEERWIDRDVFAYTRDGNGGQYGWSGGCLVAANFNTFVSRTITVQTMWPEGTWIHDYSGHCSDATVGNNGMVTITLPSNAYSRGVSYGLFAPGGVNFPIPSKSYRTLQSFVADKDGTLDVMPLVSGMNMLPQSIRIASSSRVTLHCIADIPASNKLEMALVGVYSNGEVPLPCVRNDRSFLFTGLVPTEDYYVIRITSDCPVVTAFTLAVSYQGAA